MLSCVSNPAADTPFEAECLKSCFGWASGSSLQHLGTPSWPGWCPSCCTALGTCRSWRTTMCCTWMHGSPPPFKYDCRCTRVPISGTLVAITDNLTKHNHIHGCAEPTITIRIPTIATWARRAAPCASWPGPITQGHPCACDLDAIPARPSAVCPTCRFITGNAAVSTYYHNQHLEHDPDVALLPSSAWRACVGIVSTGSWRTDPAPPLPLAASSGNTGP